MGSSSLECPLATGERADRGPGGGACRAAAASGLGSLGLGAGRLHPLLPSGRRLASGSQPAGASGPPMESQEFSGPSGLSAGHHTAETSARSEALQKPVVRIFDRNKQLEESEEAGFSEETDEQDQRGESEEYAESDEIPNHSKPYELYQSYESHKPLKPHAPYEPHAPHEVRKPREPRKPQGPPVPRKPHKSQEIELLPRASVMVSPSLLMRLPPQFAPSSLSGRCFGLSGH